MTLSTVTRKRSQRIFFFFLHTRAGPTIGSGGRPSAIGSGGRPSAIGSGGSGLCCGVGATSTKCRRALISCNTSVQENSQNVVSAVEAKKSGISSDTVSREE